MTRERIAIIMGSESERNALQNRLDPNRERFVVLRPLEAIAGYRFNAILIGGSFDARIREVSFSERSSIRRWLNEDVAMRLDIGGVMVSV